MNRRAPYGILLVIFILQISAGAGAQSVDDRDRINNEISITDEIIERAREIVFDSRSQRARVLLASAENMQSQAKKSFQGASFGFSLKLTLEARQKANQSIGVARNETLIEESVMRIAEETVARIIRVREVIVENNLKADRAMRLIDEARNLLEQARANTHELRFQLGLKLAENARDRALKAEQQVRRIRALKETTERRLAVLESLIERAQIRVAESGNTQAERRLGLATEQLDMARTLLLEGRYAAARITLEKSEKILRSLIRQLPAPPSSEAESHLQRVYRLLERAEEMVAANEPGYRAGQREPIERARGLLERAGQAISNGRSEEATRLIIQAQNLLRRAVGGGEQDEPDRDGIAALIERVEALHDEVVIIMEDCSEEGMITLFERAADHVRKSRAYLDDEQLKEAEAEAKIAQNLYNRIREICSMR
jgi:hypothetical protein